MQMAQENPQLTWKVTSEGNGELWNKKKQENREVRNRLANNWRSGDSWFARRTNVVTVAGKQDKKSLVHVEGRREKCAAFQSISKFLGIVAIV